jgi:hypothetical protein
MTDGTILVDARGAARRIEALGMRCDAKEIPDPLGSEKPTGWWISGECTVSGSASKGALDGETTPVNMRGTVALAVVAGRLLGIFSTNSKADPALWLSWSISALHIETAGSQGMFKKRPSRITVKGPDSVLVMSHVGRLYRNTNRLQQGQEGSLLGALGSPA